jgi:hypothetical protein
MVAGLRQPGNETIDRQGKFAGGVSPGLSFGPGTEVW